MRTLFEVAYNGEVVGTVWAYEPELAIRHYAEDAHGFCNMSGWSAVAVW